MPLGARAEGLPLGARAEGLPQPALPPPARRRGPHTFFKQAGTVARWGGYTVNLIHYADAAELCFAALTHAGADGKTAHGQAFVGCDGSPITFEVGGADRGEGLARQEGGRSGPSHLGRPRCRRAPPGALQPSGWEWWLAGQQPRLPRGSMADQGQRGCLAAADHWRHPSSP